MWFLNGRIPRPNLFPPQVDFSWFILRPMRSPVRLLVFALSLLMPPVASAALLDALTSLAPDADARVLRLALEARDCAVIKGLARPSERLAVIDFARPSTEPRLWVFDLHTPQLLYVEHVAHGRGSGEAQARQFSNREGSHQSSLGLFRTGETYVGGNGYSLRLDGLERGINDRARDRAIVVHGAAYVDPQLALRQGRLGRSFGCPAVRNEVARPLIDSIKHGQLLFAYYPDPDWQQTSTLLSCAAATAATPGGNQSAASARP